MLGLTFKENVPDLRNSRVPDILRELASFGIEAMVHDPLADAGAARREYGLALAPLELLRELDALVLAVPHRGLSRARRGRLWRRCWRRRGILIDVQVGAGSGAAARRPRYWSL